MSADAESGQEMSRVDRLTEFLRLYYKEDVLTLAQHYPREKRSLEVEWSDLNAFDPDIAEDYINHYEIIHGDLIRALQQFDNPINCDFQSDVFGDANVRMSLPDSKCYSVAELRAKNRGKYLGVEGKLARITDPNEKAEIVAFECQRCGTTTTIPQANDEFQEPHQCSGCERQGPFVIDWDNPNTRMVDQAKVLLQQPPDDASNKTGQGAEMTVFVEEDLIEFGSEYGLAGRVGEDCTVYGTVELEQKTQGKKKMPTFDRYFIADAISFEEGDDQVEVEPYLDQIREFAAVDNPYQLFAENIAPEIHATPAWKKADLMGAAYLFGAPRIDPENGPTYRGDIHMLIIGDPGMAKSVFLRAIDDVSPDSIRRSATGLSSDVGLTAAAVQDDFGEGNFTLKPGILVQAGAHTIIDEIDKGPSQLEKINDALEGDQMITVSKGGIHATLKTRTGLLASGNPEHGRFDPNIAYAEQLDIEPTLLSRFDAVIILKDEVEKEQDDAVAGHILRSYRESAAQQKYDDGYASEVSVEADVTERDVPIEVMTAWVKYARENIFPEIPEDVEDRLREFYVDVRELNKEVGSNKNHIPATARKLEAGIRYSVAFARLRLSETVEMQDAEMAIELSKMILGESYDPEKGAFVGDQFTEAREKTQADKVETILDLLPGKSDDPVSASLIAGETGLGIETVEHRLDKLKKNGRIVEPQQGVFRKI